MAEENKGETPAWNVRGPEQQRFSKKGEAMELFQRAMLLDPELAKSYEGLRALGKDAKAAKEAFKMKWAATIVKGESMKRKSTSTEQVQGLGRDGRFAPLYYIKTQEGEACAKSIQAYCEGKAGWSKWCEIRSEWVYWYTAEIGSDMNYKRHKVEEKEDALTSLEPYPHTHASHSRNSAINASIWIE
eukprot:6482730-Amphidinium_carterae.1